MKYGNSTKIVSRVVGFSLRAEVKIDDVFCPHHNLAGLSCNGTVRGYANIQARPVRCHDVLGFAQRLDVSRGRIEHSEHGLFDAVIDYLSIHSYPLLYNGKSKTHTG